MEFLECKTYRSLYPQMAWTSFKFRSSMTILVNLTIGKVIAKVTKKYHMTLINTFFTMFPSIVVLPGPLCVAEHAMGFLILKDPHGQHFMVVMV